ncbi:MAG: hypothetical protein JXR78_07140 [Victivallales bacterium]|nr:hypothetical protein [Victivallales bacterium]
MIKLFVAAMFMMAVTVLLAQVQDISTSDGTVYRGARIVGSNPSGIDILYENDGRTVLKGLSFEELPEDIRQKYGYDPSASKRFAGHVDKFSEDDIEDAVTARGISGGNVQNGTYYVQDNAGELKAMVYAYRRSVTLSPVSAAPGGTVVLVDKLLSGKKLGADLIFVEGLSLGNGAWTGVIYPAAVRIRLEDYDFGLRVFTPVLERSTQILADHITGGSEKEESVGNPAIVQKPGAPASSVNVELTPYDDSPMHIVTGSFGTYIYGGYYPYYRYRHHRRHNHRPHPRPKPLPCPQSQPGSGSTGRTTVIQSSGAVATGGGTTRHSSSPTSPRSGERNVSRP